EPPTVTPRDHQVLSSLDDETRRVDRGELEAPRLHEGEIVVEPAVDTSRQSCTEALEDERADPAVEGGGVEIRQHGSHRVDESGDVEIVDALGLAFQVRPKGFLTLSRQTELDDVPFAHPVGELEVGKAGWSHRRRGCDRDDPVGKAGGSGKGVKPASGKSPRSEPLESERVGD